MKDYKTKFFNKKRIRDKFKDYVLGVDIGGTNTNLCVSGVENNRPIVLYSINYETNKLSSIVPALNETIKFSEKYHIYLKKACIGAPGVVSSDKKFADLTNIKWNIDSDEITKKTNLELIYILNDFQALGYGLNLLKKEDVKLIKKGKKSPKETKAIIGPGTGFGKTILSYDNKNCIYVPIKSEGGHVDFPIRNSYELELVDFIKEFRKINNPLTIEELLSGRGIENIYYFLRSKNPREKNKILDEIDSSEDKASLISKNKNKDETCKKTFILFTKFLARCAKNFALDTLCTGGLYIAGGISSKNVEIFVKDDFQKEFTNAYRKSKVLEKIPIYLINNYDISMYGACLYTISKMG